MQYKKHYIRWILVSVMVLQISGACSQTSIDSGTDVASEQWYQKWLSTGNVLLSHYCSVTYQDTIGKKESFSAALKTSKELYFYIPDQYQQIDQYGNQYIRAYLYNFTDTAVALDRYDDALGMLQHYFKPDTTWIQSVVPPIGVCGNGIWTQQLQPNHYLSLRIGSGSLSKGNISIPYKIMLKINQDVVIEAKPITVKLLGSQVNAISQTIKPDNTLH